MYTARPSAPLFLLLEFDSKKSSTLLSSIQFIRKYLLLQYISRLTRPEQHTLMLVHFYFDTALCGSHGLKIMIWQFQLLFSNLKTIKKPIETLYFSSDIYKDDLIKVMVGCKSDLVSQRVISSEKGQELAIRLKARYVH